MANALDVSALAGVDAAILSDNVLQTREGLVAGYRPDTQSLRVFLRDRGVNVILAMPEGARAASYEEHDASWVLPTVLSIPTGVAASVLSTYVLEWLKVERKRLPSEDSPPITVRYREADLDLENGKITIRELEAPVDDLIELLEARRDEPLPPG